MYRPLPKELTIKKSLIEGLGLFTNNNLSANTELGISHVEDIKFEDNYIRTPLGGFVNHSPNPNCEFYIDDNYITDGLFNTRMAEPLARLGYMDYGVINADSIFSKNRPELDNEGKLKTTLHWDGLYK